MKKEYERKCQFWGKKGGLKEVPLGGGEKSFKTDLQQGVGGGRRVRRGTRMQDKSKKMGNRLQS